MFAPNKLYWKRAEDDGVCKGRGWLLTPVSSSQIRGAHDCAPPQ